MKAILTFCGLFIFVCLIAICDVEIAFSQIPSGWEFKDELISYMESPKDTIYIKDRKKLRRVRHRRCISNGVRFADSSLSVFIQISDKVFHSHHHKINLPLIDTNDHSVYWDGLVDGKNAYGIDFDDFDVKDVYGRDYIHEQPINDLANMNIVWNGVTLKIPKRAIENFYRIWLCDSHARPVEAFVTKDGKFLYIYIGGADGALSYAVKFVFDRNGYITRIVNQNECSDEFDFLDANASCD